MYEHDMLLGILLCQTWWNACKKLKERDKYASTKNR